MGMGVFIDNRPRRARAGAASKRAAPSPWLSAGGKLANLPKVRCPPLAAPTSFAPTKQTNKKTSGVPFLVAERGGAGEEGARRGNIQHAARTQQE